MSDEQQDRPEPKRVMVTTRKFHTLRGVEHTDGETYEVDEDQVQNLLAQGLITNPDLPPPPPPAEPGTSHPVEPMTTENTPAVVPTEPKPAE